LQTRFLLPNMLFKSFYTAFQHALPSMPYNNLIEDQNYTVAEALEAIAPSFRHKQLRRHALSLPEIRAKYRKRLETSTYLSSCLFSWHQYPTPTPFFLDTSSLKLSQCCTLEHPKWHDWMTIWDRMPLVLNPLLIPVPTLEETFRGALLRLHLTEEHLPQSHGVLFEQGTTIVFRGDRTTQTRYVVEWKEKADAHHAFLKVVGTNKRSRPRPYDDPQYPTFILIVPLHRSSVISLPSPPPLYTTSKLPPYKP